MISQNKIKPTTGGVNKPILVWNTWTSPTLSLRFASCGEGGPGCLSCQGTVHASAAPILFLSAWPQHSLLAAPPVPAIGILLSCLTREHAGGWGDLNFTHSEEGLLSRDYVICSSVLCLVSFPVLRMIFKSGLALHPVHLQKISLDIKGQIWRLSSNNGIFIPGNLR